MRNRHWTRFRHLTSHSCNVECSKVLEDEPLMSDGLPIGFLWCSLFSLPPSQLHRQLRFSEYVKEIHTPHGTQPPIPEFDRSAVLRSMIKPTIDIRYAMMTPTEYIPAHPAAQDGRWCLRCQVSVSVLTSRSALLCAQHYDSPPISAFSSFYVSHNPPMQSARCWHAGPVV